MKPPYRGAYHTKTSVHRRFSSAPEETQFHSFSVLYFRDEGCEDDVTSAALEIETLGQQGSGTKGRCPSEMQRVWLWVLAKWTISTQDFYVGGAFCTTPNDQLPPNTLSATQATRRRSAARTIVVLQKASRELPASGTRRNGPGSSCGPKTGKPIVLPRGIGARVSPRSPYY